MGKKSKCFDNRELSWMQFNERVLEQAASEQVPLAERLSFLQIYQSNLDEFYMVRVAGALGLKQQNRSDGSAGMTNEEQLQCIRKQTVRLERKKKRIYEKLMGLLETEGIVRVGMNRMEAGRKKELLLLFMQDILPFVAPMYVEEQQVFPFLKSFEQYVVAVLKSKNGKTKWGIVPCDIGVCKRWTEFPKASGQYILLEDILYEYAEKIFPGYEVKEKTIVRITRSGDLDAIDLYDNDMDYREFMKRFIKKRSRLRPVRVEVRKEFSDGVKKQFSGKIGISKGQIFLVETPLEFSFMENITRALRKNKGLFYEKQSPGMPVGMDKNESVLQQVTKKDFLFCYPYESITPFFDLLSEAAEDQTVTDIEMSLYRVAERSRVVEALIRAAENGKNVVVILELRARFDEENNIKMSMKLEDAGCTVLYGLEDYKVHAKLCLITRKDENGISYITQVGTGNYNEKTATQYTDCSLVTGRKEIGEEAKRVFFALKHGNLVSDTSHLLVAPIGMQQKILNKMDRQIQRAKEGKTAYIGMKVNGLSDKKIMKKLIEASQSGVIVELIVRGICCLRPGVEGYTENIRIISIVGRFLEHSRIYLFGTGDEAEVYLSSADLLTRNMQRRVEVAVSVYDREIKGRICEMFQKMLQDTAKGREKDAEGNYNFRNFQEDVFDSQAYFYRKYAKNE